MNRKIEHNNKVYEIEIQPASSLDGVGCTVAVNGQKTYFRWGRVSASFAKTEKAKEADIKICIFPIGEWSGNAAKTLRKRDAVRVFATPDNRIYEENVREYYIEQMVDGDICHYCGFDNCLGERRVGWDCGMCGGN